MMNSGFSSNAFFCIAFLLPFSAASAFADEVRSSSVETSFKTVKVGDYSYNLATIRQTGNGTSFLCEQHIGSIEHGADGLSQTVSIETSCENDQSIPMAR